MSRFLLIPLLVLVSASTLVAQRDILRGKIKKLDLDKKIIILTVNGKDQELVLNEQTRVLGAEEKSFKERFAGLKPGDEVMFKPGEKDGKNILVALRPVRGSEVPKVDLTKLIPLNELGSSKYQGYPGGFYPDGKNERPTAHEQSGLKLAKTVQPLDSEGKSSDKGKIVLMSVGMSNTSQSSQGFQRLLEKEKGINPHLLFVNGAQGGMTAESIQNPDDKGRGRQYWDTVDARLKSAGVTHAQVQVIWIKQADAGPSQGFPKYAKKLQEELARIVQILPKRFPNVKLVYLSSRTYGGFAKTRLNPEPYAYESGFSVKWLIEQQLKGEAALNFDPKKGAVKAPWLSWGPYLWAGSTKRKDGFQYEESDFVNDGTHQSASGQRKVGQLMLDFFKSDSTTKSWFLK